MNVEVVAVGTELLLGQIVDTNSSWIGEQLALVGLDSFFQTKVGDNLDRLVDTLRRALDRSDAVIVCGGLGPTQDDLTREALGVLVEEPLDEDDTMVERIIEMFGSRGRRMPMNNLNQARKPASAEFIPVMPGTAPGLVLPTQHGVVYAVPGVPWEMKEMLTGFVLGDLSRRSGDPAAIASRTLRTWGESESGLSEMLAPRMAELDEVGNPTLAFLASGFEGLKVRITAKAADAAAATEIVDEEADHLRALLGSRHGGPEDGGGFGRRRNADQQILLADAHLIDLLPTILDAAGAGYPAEFGGRSVLPCEGQSLLSALRGDTRAEREKALFWDFRGCRAVRKGRWKIVTEGPPRLHINIPLPFATGAWELYDLETDRCETNDLSDRHPDIVRELEALWLDWSARCGRS
mgnify:CR=1 FL=1